MFIPFKHTSILTELYTERNYKYYVWVRERIKAGQGTCLRYISNKFILK